MSLRPDAGRYECGTLNTIGLFGLRASLELILEIGVERIAPAIRSLTDQLADGAGKLGYELLGPPRTPSNSSGIISIRHPQLDSRLVNARLREHGFLTSPRQGWVRISPHFYVSPGDIDAMLAALPQP